MVMESLSTMKLAWKALNALTPDVFLDTTGCAFTYIVARILANCKVGAYVHYPTISTVSIFNYERLCSFFRTFHLLPS